MDLSYAKGWRPEEGDTIIGVVADVAMGRSSQGAQRMYPIITITPDDGGEAVAVHCFHAALHNRMLELRPQVGERIGIQFKGMAEHKTNPNQTVAQYVARIEGRSADVWGALTAQDAAIRPQRSTSDTPADVSDFAPPTVADDDDIPF